MSNIALFEEKHVRREWHEEKWVFSIIDVVGILTDSDRPRKYWADLKKKLIQEGYFEVSEKIGHLKMLASDGKMRETDVADTETLLRIVQSIPSPKAEPFKRWLARVGVERLQEIENPELAMARTRAIYQAKGYSDAWIERRLRGMAVRDELTNEWKERGVKESTEYAILTAEISKATFGLTPKQYRTYKGLAKPGENLRDHMTDLELIFTMLGEASTTEIARQRGALGFVENKEAAVEGGTVAGSARKDLEHRTGKRVVSQENYLALPEAKKRQERELE